MKRYKLFVLLFIPLISSCFDDKGNYDYHEVAEITIEGLPELLEVVGGAEHILNLPAPGRRQPIYLTFRFCIDLCFC